MRRLRPARPARPGRAVSRPPRNGALGGAGCLGHAIILAHPRPGHGAARTHGRSVTARRSSGYPMIIELAAARPPRSGIGRWVTPSTVVTRCQLVRSWLPRPPAKSLAVVVIARSEGEAEQLQAVDGLEAGRDVERKGGSIADLGLQGQAAGAGGAGVVDNVPEEGPGDPAAAVLGGDVEVAD